MIFTYADSEEIAEVKKLELPNKGTLESMQEIYPLGPVMEYRQINGGATIYLEKRVNNNNVPISYN